MTADELASRVGAVHPGPWRVVHAPHPLKGPGFWSRISVLDCASRVVMALDGPDPDDRRLRAAEWLVSLANAHLAGAASDDRRILEACEEALHQLTPAHPKMDGLDRPRSYLREAISILHRRLGLARAASDPPGPPAASAPPGGPPWSPRPVRHVLQRPEHRNLGKYQFVTGYTPGGNEMCVHLTAEEIAHRCTREMGPGTLLDDGTDLWWDQTPDRPAQGPDSGTLR